MAETVDIAALLQQSAWMRRLAMSLVRDDAAADDLVQETWELALRHPPRAGQTPRPWLAQVLRNVMRAKFRSATRRVRREDTSVDKDTHVPSPEQLVGAVETQRQLADEVLHLKEPYRATVLMVFYEGLSPTEVAMREGLPAGTVRWRLKHGLDQLREKLDRKHAGDRKAWVRALGPLTGEQLRRVAFKSPSTIVWKGTSVMKMSLVAALATGVGLASWSFIHTSKAEVASPPPSIAPAPVQKANAPVPVAPTRVDKQARAELLERIDQALHAAHPESPRSVAPTLDKRYISEQIQGLVPLVYECFTNARARHPDLQGTVWVGFSIFGLPGVGGLVGGSQVIDAKSTITDEDVRECIQETMYAAKFPPPPKGGEIHVEYPFVLAPPGSTDRPLTAEQLQRLESVLKSGMLPDGTPLSTEQRRHLEMVRIGRETLGKKIVVDE